MEERSKLYELPSVTQNFLNKNIKFVFNKIHHFQVILLANSGIGDEFHDYNQKYNVEM